MAAKVQSAPATADDGGARLAVVQALRACLPDLADEDAARPWDALGLDSFEMLSLRLAAEDALGVEIADSDWVEARTPAELIALLAGACDREHAPPQPGISLTETVELGMPQMALCGLSESWLLKALGDWHWRMIGAALGSRPVDIRDASGNRLYPAFTRLRFVSSAPLAAFEEGERLVVTAALTRFGAGLFFSETALDGENGRSLSAQLMSSFTFRPEGGSNSRLLAGQPVGVADCSAPALAQMPPFGEDYASRRRARDAVRPVIARRSYELIPHYDINGVGLLYYAAYPMIADICQMQEAGDGALWAEATSTVERDICYFANADSGAALEWRLHRDEQGDGLVTEATIVRDDGVSMALVATRKARV